MELKHDWKVFNDVLFPNSPSGSSAKDAAETSDRLRGDRTLVLLGDQGHVVEAITGGGQVFAECGESISALDVARLDALASKYQTGQAIVLEKRELDRALQEAVDLGQNFYQQLELIREQLRPSSPSGVKGAKSGKGIQSWAAVTRKHFVLDAFLGPLVRWLPRSYNLVIVVDEDALSGGISGVSSRHPTFKSLLLTIQQGRVDQFYEPDFSSLGEGRLEEWRQHPEAVGHYLENRYILPCCVLFFSEAVWNECVALFDLPGGKPWLRFARAATEGDAVFYPEKTWAKSLLAGLQILGYFSRK